MGTIGTVTDNHNGTYTATFNATTVGSNTITATIGGQAVTTAAPAITVTAGSGTGTADLTQSTVSVAAPSVLTGGTTEVTLTARDAGGTQLPTGGSTVTFDLGGGSPTGTFDTVVDNGDGTYTANFTASAAGTNTIIGSIDSQPLTSTAPTGP